MSSILSIAKKISRFSNESGNIEIEARFRSIENRKTVSLGEMDFEYLFDVLSESHVSKRIVTTDYYRQGGRFTESEGDFYLTTKEEIFRETLSAENRSLKFSVSREEKTKTSFDPFGDFDMKREKERFSFLDNNMSLDLTRVITTEPDLPLSNSFEFEIEVIDPTAYDPKEFSEAVVKYFDLYDRHSKDLFLFCNLALSSNTDETETGISYNLVSRPRDLLKIDLTSPKSILQGYTVSIKADGVQFFLVIYKTGVYLVNQKGKMIRICQLLEEYRDLENSIFAGEVIKNHISDTEFSQIYLPFDVIYHQGSMTRDMDYLERIEKLKDIYNLELRCKGFNLLKVREKKIFYLGTTNEEFYPAFRKCYDEKKKIFYQDDGYIFTPNKGGYMTKGQMNRSTKNLGKFPDVCKFKPLEKRSIDFRVRGGKVYVFHRGRELEFKDVDARIPRPEEFENKIVEFFPVFERGEIVHMRPERVREDKSRPNTLDVAKELVSGYREINPITEKTFLGEDTVLMRNFNNFYIKRKLIQDIEGYVVDIGFGKGGDAIKYNKNDKILRVMGVEPNPDFYSAAKERKIGDKIFKVDDLKGEDSEKVEKEFLKVFPSDMSNGKMTVAFMISLSFFWESKEILTSLAKTIQLIHKRYKERGGKFKTEIVFYTIDGYKVEKFFQEEKSKVFKEGSINLRLVGENQVFINISDSKTVFNQTEYLVKLDQLYSVAGLREVYTRDPKMIGLLMSSSERKYLSLHTYGKAFVEREMEIAKSIERLPVDTKMGVIKGDGTILAKGDDELDSVLQIDENIYRVATIDEGMSLQHSFLKLVSGDYRRSGYGDRVEMAQKIVFEGDLEDFCTSNRVGIKIHKSDSSTTFGDRSDKWILLHQTMEGSFEPLIYILDDKVHYTFQKDSFLIM
jgi:hypothetical protein